MTTSSSTVGALAAQIAALRDAQDEQKSLLLDVLREMLKISQVQAESTFKFLTLVEAQAASMAAFARQGPGTTRTMTDQSEYDEWRATLDETRRD